MFLAYVKIWEAIHDKIRRRIGMSYIDMHCDTISCLMKQKSETLLKNHFCVDLEKMEVANTGIQFFACFVNAGSYEKDRTIEQKKEANGMRKIKNTIWNKAYADVLKMIERIDGEQNQKLAVATSYQEVQDCLQQGKIVACKTVEEGGVLNGNLERLKELYSKGIRLLTLTWNYANCIGYPNSTDASIMKKGLTPFGIDTIQQMNELGMMIDVSHLSDGGFYDCIRYSKMPICASHSNARGLCKHPRNLSDQMLKMLGEKGGVSGLNFCTHFLREDENVMVDDIAEHAKYMIEKGGEELVALGSDFDGFENPRRENWVNNVNDMPLLWDAFRRKGITERQIDKIMWKNALRFMKETINYK